MASFDNDKRNWGNYSSESMNNREDAKSRRSAKPNVEIYRPGSGPLKRTSHGEGDTSNNDKQRITPEKSTSAVADSGKNARKPNFEHRDKKGDVKASEKTTAAVVDSAKNVRKPNFEHNDKKSDVRASEKTTAAVVDSAKNMRKQNSEHNDEKIKVPERDKRNTEKGIRDIVDETKNIRISDSSASNPPRSEGRQRFKKPGQVLYVPKACNQVNSERVVLNTVKDASSKPTVTQKFKNDEVSGTRKYNMGSNGKKPACVYSTLEKQQNISSNSVKKSEVVKDRPCEWAEENWDEDEDDKAKKTVNVTQPVENFGRKQEPINTTKKSFEKPVSSVMDHGIKSSESFRSKDANSKNFKNNSDWRSESPSFSRGSDFRHGSEPRSLPPDLHRMRDTRSVEPTDKKHTDKPPSGRRGSLRDGNAKGYHPSYESLPPRFQKKYLTENAIKKVNPERNYLEDSWDGNSLVFQGNSNNNNNPTHHVPPVQAWTHTYPNRGRGRLKPHELEFDRIIVNAVKYGQSLSQEKSLGGNFGQEMGLTSVQNINHFLVRENLPVTRQHHALLEDRSGPNLRMRNIITKTDIPETTTVEASKNVTPSTISKEEISHSAKDSSFQVTPKVLDWSEEVEQSERLAAAGSGGSAPDVTAPSIENDKSSRSQRTKEKRKRRKRDSTSNENFSNVEDDDKGENSRHKEWDKCEVERRHDGRGRSNRYEDKDNGRTNHSKDQNDKYDKRDDHNQNRNTRQHRDSRREYSLERSGRKERNYSLGRNSNRGNRPPSLDRYNDRQYDRDRNSRQHSKDRRYNNRSDRQLSQEREYSRGGFNQERSNNIEAAPHNKNWSLRNRHGSLERNHDKGYPDDGSRDSYSDRNDNKGNRARSNERNYNQGYKPPSGDIKNDKLKNPPPTGQRRNDDRGIRNHSQERRNYRDARRTSCDRSESSYRGSRPSSRERYNKPFARNVPSRESSWDRSRVHPGWDRRSSYDSDSISLSHERNIDYNSHSRYQSDFDDRLSWRRDSIHSLKDGSSREFCQTRSQNEGNDNNNWREQNMLRRDAEVKSSSQFSSFDKNSEGKRSDTEECLSRADVKSWRDAVEQDDDRDTRNIPSAQDINQIEKLSLSTSVSESRVRGIIMLPNQLSAADIAIVQPTVYPRFPSVNAVIPSCSVVYSPKNAVGSLHHASAPQQHILFNHIDPSKPITVSTRSNRSVPQGFESFRQGQNQPAIMMDVDRLQNDLQLILNNGCILRDWNQIMYYRQLLQNCLITLLMKDIKFCETKNMEHHFWKILFYDIIELLRKAMKDNEDNKDLYKGTLLTVIDEGTVYYESLIDGLEKTYKFKLDDILHTNVTPNKDLGYVSVALHSIQKILLFLGDLARYKEQINESSNFGKSRQYYIKAHQINPKNGRPYNQLAVLAGYVKRKIDAVYYYMRSLMASIPVQSARENLLPMFEDSRKKYEQFERKRRDERERKRRESMKDKESASLRREYWIHPDGTRPRLHITSTVHDMREEMESGDDDLSTLTSSEINKRFIITYLNVQGKLFTKIGMETFQETAIHMLREFRALLQHSPLPLNANRLLQLLALNMFAIENTQLKDGGRLESSYRSAIQENALIVSLQMFSLILEKCVALLKDQLNSHSNSEDPSSSRLVLGEDILVLLPPVKVWCDWLLCHTKVWNPPPSCADFRVGPPGDPWSRMASLVNLLEKLPLTEVDLLTECREGYEVVRLPEDATLYGFTPLMSITQEPVYVRKDADMEEAQLVLRIRKIIFFGTVYLCGVDPPVLKLQKYDTGHSEYISIVASYSQQSYSPVDEQSDSEIQIESFSEDEGVGSGKGTEDYPDLSDSVSTPEEIRSLLHRKEELERRHQRQEKHRKHVQAILRETVVSIEIEVKPRCLVPDTNCFIDYLPQLQKITQAKSSEQQQPLYCLMVPLVVLKELEGLTRGGKDRDFIPLPDVSPEHAFQVAEKAKAALSFLRSKHPGVRCVTTKGTVLALTTCIMEEDTEPEQRNDDRILSTCLSLCHMKEHQNPGEPRRLYREVVLLTEDRNLRVKALARYVPVREVSDFMQWADLG